jgi:hypothetical protein
MRSVKQDVFEPPCVVRSVADAQTRIVFAATARRIELRIEGLAIVLKSVMSVGRGRMLLL